MRLADPTEQSSNHLPVGDTEDRRPAPPWPTRVQKFGGTSVGDIDRIDKVAERVSRAVAAGEKVAVVVSAMGRTTDRLIGMARELTTRPSRRELDALLATGEQQSAALLTLALMKRGVSARSFTGPQADRKSVV